MRPRRDPRPANSAPPPAAERRGGGRSRGSHARSPERATPRAAIPKLSIPKPFAPRPLASDSFSPQLGGPGAPGAILPDPTSRRAGSAASASAADSALPPTGPPVKGWHGPRTVRAKIVALLMVPIISLMALWGLASVSTAQDAWSLIQLRTVNSDLRQPLYAAISSLQQERTVAMRILSTSSTSDETSYLATFRPTDNASTDLQNSAESAAAALNYLGSDTQQRINALLAVMDSLGTLRGQVEHGGVSISAAYSSYCAAIDDAFAVEGSLATLQDDAVGSNAQSVMLLAQAGEMLARQDSVLAAAYATGTVSAADYQEFVGAAYSQNIMQLDAIRALSPTDQTAYQHITNSPQYIQLRDDQSSIEAAGPGPIAATRFSQADWSKPEAAILTSLNAVAATAAIEAVDRLDPYSALLDSPQGIAVLLGLAAVLISLLLSVRIGRGLVMELIGLRDTALDLAHRRLPGAIARLRAGQSIDVDIEAPPAVQVEDEIGQVSEALAAAARAAIQAAVERAEVVNSVAGVFLNLARRSQLLVHRQLALLDTMERRNDDPDELEDLFRLDHLATRMRRHAEGLIILSGATPGRGWRRPVPLMDVLRAAVAEVEDYARVDVRRVDQVHLAGGAVADLTHLIAELVENATAFSPPHTRVQVRGEQVGSGFAIDIEDRGLGMGDQAIAEANGRIAIAEQSDLFDSDRLGLFVVSRLSRRHNIQVSLGRSAYGGTTAIVLLPKALLENTAAGSFSEAEERGFGAAGTAEADRAGADPSSNRPDAEHRTGQQPLLIGAPGAGEPPAKGPRPATNGHVRRLPDLGAPGPARPAPRAEPQPEPQPEPPQPEPSLFEPAPARQTPPRPRPPIEPPIGPLQEPRPDQGERLPRRIRQANLAPQLRSDPSARPDSADYTARPADGISPERARATMSAFQDGWARGRQAPGAEPGSAPPARSKAQFKAQSTADTENGGDPTVPPQAQENS